MDVTVNPHGHFNGDISLPGDKSISHRVALLAAFADGASCLRNFASNEDCRSTLRVLSQLGVSHEELKPGTVTVFGCGGRFTAPSETLNCGNSGTTARLLMGILASQPFDAIIDGDPSLRTRPMGHVAALLREMGVDVLTCGASETLPVWIQGKRLAARKFTPKLASAQLKSAVLVAGLKADGITSVTEFLPTRDHMERAMRMAGLQLNFHGQTVSLEGGQTPKCFDVDIPGDISSGAFWMALAAPQKGSRMILRNIGLNRCRLGFVDALLRMRVGIREEVISCDEGEWFGNLDIRGGPLRPIQIEPGDIPSLIDEIPILAIMAAKANGVSTIRGASTLRGKETDRITAIAVNLKRMGVDVEEFPDGMAIYGTGHLRGAEVDSFGDHRIAMTFAIAGLLAADGTTTIHNAECMAISYPEFQRDLQSLVEVSGSNLSVD